MLYSWIEQKRWSHQMDVGFNVGACLSNKLHCEVVERLIVRLQRNKSG